MTPTQADAAVAVLRALANPLRLRIVVHLCGGEAAVAALEQALQIRQPSLSQQLAELREAGVVTTRRAARTVFYTLAAPQRMMTLLQGLTDAPLPPTPAPSRQGSAQAAVFAQVSRA